ncbi:type II toxin-antitoxin system HicB family antitoxin [Sulfobacillus thermosulfidooxidans]|uniref:type II toxin-antitoxin system HicB family antitoxin n=1 Tax=Sulfobacillus thermosulfidooxidans TaxID=28034 RepID=UPI0006B4CD4A|nr:hypothetical protein [Sulfobacillus thermosulfidooxidans]
MEITVIVEQLPDSQEFLAYSDEVQCLATGNTAEQAMQNFREALHHLMTHYGNELMADLSHKSIRQVPLT